MKILKNNYTPPPPEWPKTVRCYFCDSRLEIEKKDVKFPSRYNIYVKPTIKCPCCGKTSDIIETYPPGFFDDPKQPPVIQDGKSFFDNEILPPK